MIPDLIIVTGMESVRKTGVETTFEVIAKSGNGVVETAIAVGVELETSVVFRVENAACLEAEIKAGPGFYRVKGSAVSMMVFEVSPAKAAPAVMRSEATKVDARRRVGAYWIIVIFRGLK